MLREGLLVPVRLYNSENMIRRETGRSRIMAVQMDNLTGLPCIRRMDRVLNVRIRIMRSSENDELMKRQKSIRKI